MTWLADYYKSPLGQVLHMALPPAARSINTRGLLDQPYTPAYTDVHNHQPDVTESHTIVAPHQLREEQRYAVQQIAMHLQHYHCFLLDGVTGSGKTEVYLQLIELVLQKDKQVLILVPEIGLTPQMLRRVQERFAGRFAGHFAEKVVGMHSQYTAKQRFILWQGVRTGNISILIGTRSAIFTEFADLGLIVVDEEHDTSFKQQEGVRYNARHLAVKRAYELSIPIVLGSATPALETLYFAQKGLYSWLKLQQKVSAQPVSWSIIPAPNKNSSKEEKASGLNQILLEAVTEQLEQKHQVLVFINRRGYAPGLRCRTCSWQALCQHCDARMVLHKFPRIKLVCHYCDTTQIVMTSCPQCGNHTLKSIGEGTQKLEDQFIKTFSDYPVIRIDRDSTRGKNKLASRLEPMHQGTPAILIGTQMLTKGHHFPNISLVIILGVDHALSSPDFRALERLAQQLIQVSGRAGRGKHQALAMIQTQHIQHPALRQLTQCNYNQIATSILQERKPFAFPPFGYLVALHARAKKPDKLFLFLEQAKQQMLQILHGTDTTTSDIQHGIKVTGPVENIPAKKADYYYATLMLHATHRPSLHFYVHKLWKILATSSSRAVQWHFDVDPV